MVHASTEANNEPSEMVLVSAALLPNCGAWMPGVLSEHAAWGSAKGGMERVLAAASGKPAHWSHLVRAALEAAVDLGC